MQIIQAQMAFFYDNEINLDFDGLSYFVKKNFKEKIGVPLLSNQQLTFLPNDAPAEIPRVQFNSEDKKIQIQCSKLRCDLFYEPSIKSEEFMMELFSSMIHQIYNAHEMITKKINRVGFVAIGSLESISPNKYIADKYLNPQNITKTDELTDVSVTFNRPFSQGGVNLNCITTYNTGQNLANSSAVLIKQIDVNTSLKDDFSSHNNLSLILEAFNEKITDSE